MDESKRKKKPKRLREAEKAHDANIYKEGFDHGYRMGIEEGKRIALKQT